MVTHFFEENVRENFVTKLGSQYVSTIIMELNLPIGYINTYVAFDEEGCTLGIDKRFSVEAQLNPLYPGDKLFVKALLLDGLKIEGMKIKEKWPFCPKCEKSFHPRNDFRYCPYCGTQLEYLVI
jgi:ribosomal protein S27AE